MPKLEKNGRIKVVSQGTLNALGDRLDGWKLVHENIVEYSSKKTYTPTTRKGDNIKTEADIAPPKRKSKDLTVDEIRQYLKKNNISFHHKLGSEKLKKLYNEQIGRNKE